MTIGQRYASSFAHVKRVGVIGAGVAGLQTARSLKARGFEVEVFEKAPDVGGLWRENYVSSGVQIRKNYYGLLDEEIPHGDWASTPEIQKYILGFVDKHNLRSMIRFNTEVSSVSPRADGQRGWDFVVKDKDGKEATHSLDFAVVSHGLYSQTANMPTLPGKESFSGPIIHSSQFLSEDLVKGKKVVVIGGGKSAMDIAKVASKVGESSVLLYRQAHWITPQSILGLIPTEWIFMSRLGQALVGSYKGAWPDAPSGPKLAHTLLAPVMHGVFALLGAIFAVQRKHYGDFKPEHDFVADFYNVPQLQSAEFTQMVDKGEITATKGSVKSVEADGVVLGSGEKVPCDVIVCATGFGSSYPFFDAATLSALGVEKDGLYLYRHLLAPKVQDIAFVGAEASTLENSVTYGLQAEWLARALVGAVELPSADKMQTDVDALKAWKRSWMPESPYRSALILAHFLHYHDSLLADMKETPFRKSPNFLAEMFAPYTYKDYNGIVGAQVAK